MMQNNFQMKWSRFFNFGADTFEQLTFYYNRSIALMKNTFQMKWIRLLNFDQMTIGLFYYNNSMHFLHKLNDYLWYRHF